MVATRNDLCSNLYFEKTLSNYLKCDRSLVNGEYQLNHFRHTQQKSSGGGGGGGGGLREFCFPQPKF